MYKSITFNVYYYKRAEKYSKDVTQHIANNKKLFNELIVISDV